jgi:hypothetical protein
VGMMEREGRERREEREREERGERGCEEEGRKKTIISRGLTQTSQHVQYLLFATRAEPTAQRGRAKRQGRSE